MNKEKLKPKNNMKPSSSSNFKAPKILPKFKKNYGKASVEALKKATKSL